ncbi:hypothetical protein DRO61_01130, partial [Candidatus Bathyarchaeota archaeon]
MGRLSEEDVLKELKIKNLSLKSPFTDYKSINSMIKVSCLNGHEIQTNLKTIRAHSFACPTCVGNASKGFDGSPTIVPEKSGHRVLGFDNASHKMGVSIFDSGKLVYYHLLEFNQGTATQRLLKIRQLLEKTILPAWEPDFVQIEDIQHQSSYATYEVLVKLVGIFEMACEMYKIPMSKDRSSVWRSHFGINKKARAV